MLMFYICSGSNTDDESIRPYCYNNNKALLIMRARSSHAVLDNAKSKGGDVEGEQTIPANLSTTCSSLNDSEMSRSHASNVSDENQSSCIVDRSRFSTIRTRLRQRSAEQLLTATDERNLYISVSVGVSTKLVNHSAEVSHNNSLCRARNH
jgi:hypothetical protein